MKSILKTAKAFDNNGGLEDVEKKVQEIESLFNRKFVISRYLKFARKMLKKRDKLFIFVTKPNVEATNNWAECSVRSYVVLRKVSGGTKSPKGTKNVEVLASAIQTCRMNGTDLIEKGRDLIGTKRH